MSAHRLLGGIAGLQLMVLAHSAAAQSSVQAAEALFEEGRAAMERRDFATACTKFRESDRLDPAPGTLLNLANCEEQRGRVATAWVLFGQALGKLDAADNRAAVARQRREALAPRIPNLRITLHPGASPETRVLVGELEFSSPSFGSFIPMDPGRRPVVVLAPGRGEERTTVDLEEGERVELTVPLRLEPVAVAAPVGDAVAAPAVAPPDAEDQLLGLDRRYVAYGAGAVGLVGLVVGSVAGVAGLKKEATGDANCSDVTRTCNQKGVEANAAARSLATWSTVGFAVGIAGLGGGAYLYFTAAPTQPAPLNASRPSRIGFGWRGTW